MDAAVAQGFDASPVSRVAVPRQELGPPSTMSENGRYVVYAHALPDQEHDAKICRFDVTLP
jgi:hypothetical protein